MRSRLKKIDRSVPLLILAGLIAAVVAAAITIGIADAVH